jgi:hypothetical protein
MSYLDQISLATDPEFTNRVQQAAIKTAIAISSEASSGDAELDAARLNYATRVLHSPQNYARLMAYGVATADGISAASSDSQIESAVISLWNAYSGSNPNQ